MAYQDVPTLSQFFRMALVAGVERAVQIHIDRGDDLNARDEKGQTPLMLSAVRNKAAVCKMLLTAGADAGLVDPSGRDALSLAQAAGAFEAASIIETAYRPPTTEIAPVQLPQAGSETSDVSLANHEFEQIPLPAAVPERAPLALDCGSVFDLSGWEAEETQAPPDGDPSLAVAAIEIQTAINEHQPIDTSSDWWDFDAFLPDRATPLPHADDAEARERLRLILLRAIREGSVPQAAVEDSTRGDDGEPDADAGALLGMVINDLGAETDERFEYSAPHENFQVFVAPDTKPDEEDAVDDALAFIDELASRRNEPLRLYQRDLQREALLTAEAEVALGQAMERGVEKALDALAAWPAGITATLEAARQVANGAKPLRSMSSVPQVEPEDAHAARAAGIDAAIEVNDALEPPAVDGELAGADDAANSQFALEAKESTNELADFCANAEHLSGLLSPTGVMEPLRDRHIGASR